MANKVPVNVRLESDRFDTLKEHADAAGLKPGTLARVLLTRSLDRMKSDATERRMTQSAIERYSEEG